MEYIKAIPEQSQQIFELVQSTIKATYPKYYPKEVVDFFCELHNKEKIEEDINNGSLGILIDNSQLVGTGSYNANHITRVYVSPDFQSRGYGSIIMENLESQIALKYSTACLDSSLPASHFYEKRGYKTTKHEKWNVENGAILVYEIMEKNLRKHFSPICYDGKYFISKSNTDNGEVDSNTVFCYHQDSNIIWADYNGGDVIKGHLIGTVSETGELDFYYQHINKSNQLRIGKCHSIPHILDNGKIELAEEWQWLNGDKSKGLSVIVEKSLI